MELRLGDAAPIPGRGPVSRPLLDSVLRPGEARRGNSGHEADAGKARGRNQEERFFSRWIE